MINASTDEIPSSRQGSRHEGVINKNISNASLWPTVTSSHGSISSDISSTIIPSEVSPHEEPILLDEPPSSLPSLSLLSTNDSRSLVATSSSLVATLPSPSRRYGDITRARSDMLTAISSNPIILPYDSSWCISGHGNSSLLSSSPSSSYPAFRMTPLPMEGALLTRVLRRGLRQVVDRLPSSPIRIPALSGRSLTFDGEPPSCIDDDR
jgi:hypothetical protein